MTDLKDLIELPAGWLPSPIPEDINEYGQIAAVAFSGTNHMLLRLTPKPQIASTISNDGAVTIRLRAGSDAALSVQASTDFKNWSEVKALVKPGCEEIVQRSAEGTTAQFFRVIRSAP